MFARRTVWRNSGNCLIKVVLIVIEKNYEISND